jgi:hypothetical protein
MVDRLVANGGSVPPAAHLQEDRFERSSVDRAHD